MKNADQAGSRQRFREFGGFLNSWDKVAGWISLLVFVLGGTQVLLAQHSHSNPAASAHKEKSQTTPLHDDSVASGQERRHWSAEPGCSEQTGNIPDRSVSRSWTLASPDGLYKAYAENEAIAERSPSGEITRCKSTSKLYVIGRGAEAAKAVFEVAPLEDASENSVELIDWSRDEHRLLVIAASWADGTDSAAVEARIYDGRTGKVTPEDFTYGTFRQIMGRQCAVILDPLGFSADGKLVLKAGPYLDEEQKIENDSCLKKIELWAQDPVSARLHRLPDDYKVQRYGWRYVEPNEPAADGRR